MAEQYMHTMPGPLKFLNKAAGGIGDLLGGFVPGMKKAMSPEGTLADQLLAALSGGAMAGLGGFGAARGAEALGANKSLLQALTAPYGAKPGLGMAPSPWNQPVQPHEVWKLFEGQTGAGKLGIPPMGGPQQGYLDVLKRIIEGMG